MNSEFAHIFYQGSPGAYSHAAAKTFAARLGCTTVNVAHCESFEAVARQLLEEDSPRYGVLPLENSSIGAIAVNYDLIRNFNLRIIGELFMPIRHCLLAKAGVGLSQITSVYSHFAALEQCRKFFDEHRHMTAVEYRDTAGAAELVRLSNVTSIAAIACEDAAAIYDLEVIRHDIQDYPDNQTRFALVQAEPKDNHASGVPKLPAKISLLFEKIGRANLSARFGVAAGEAITSIVTRPDPEVGWTYFVYVDVLCTKAEQLQQLVQFAGDRCRVLGVYPGGACDSAGR